jgi:hypothetical protein
MATKKEKHILSFDLRICSAIQNSLKFFNFPKSLDPTACALGHRAQLAKRSVLRQCLEISSRLASKARPQALPVGQKAILESQKSPACDLFSNIK